VRCTPEYRHAGKVFHDALAAVVVAVAVAAGSATVGDVAISHGVVTGTFSVPGGRCSAAVALPLSLAPIARTLAVRRTLTEHPVTGMRDESHAGRRGRLERLEEKKPSSTFGE
jgi:hypothetical protein